MSQEFSLWLTPSVATGIVVIATGLAKLLGSPNPGLKKYLQISPRQPKAAGGGGLAGCRQLIEQVLQCPACSLKSFLPGDLSPVLFDLRDTVPGVRQGAKELPIRKTAWSVDHIYISPIGAAFLCHTAEVIAQRRRPLA